MSRVDVDALCAVAEAATSGRWRAAEQTHDAWYGIQSPHFALGNVFLKKDATHIATFDPPTVLTILDHLAAETARADAAEARLGRVEAVLAELICECGGRPDALYVAHNVRAALNPEADQ